MNISGSKFYNDIEECPLFNWVKINEGKLNYIIKGNIQKEETEEELSEAYNILYDSYIEKLGLSNEYKKLLNLMKKKAVLELDYILQEDEFLQTKIEIEERRLKEIIKGEEKENQIEKTLIYLSKWVGYRLPIKEVTVLEFYTILNEYGKAN